MLEMDADSQYLTVAEMDLEYCFRAEMIAQLERLRSEDCSGYFTNDAVRNFSRIRIAVPEKKTRFKRVSSF